VEEVGGVGGDPSEVRAAMPASAPSRDPASDLDPFVIKILESILLNSLVILLDELLILLVNRKITLKL